MRQIWVKYRFQKRAGAQRWEYEEHVVMPDWSKAKIRRYMKEIYEDKCSEEARHYENGAHIEWIIMWKTLPPKHIILNLIEYSQQLVLGSKNKIERLTLNLRGVYYD